MTHSIPCFLLLALTFALQDGGEPNAEAPPPPRDVTVETLADPEALRALQAPGELVFEDDFER